MLNDHCTNQYFGAQSRPYGRAGMLSLVEQADQLTQGNQRTQRDPLIGGIQPIVEGSFKSDKGKLTLAYTYAI
jgi:hypothetical protein